MVTSTIRGAELSDLPYCYEICVKTGDAGKDASGLFYDPYVIGQYYAAPYLFFERDLCFVAELNGIPQGYIIGVSDTHAFNGWLESDWLPPLQKRYRNYPLENIKTDAERNAIALFYKNLNASKKDEDSLYKTYPAHLHIDLLPSLQGQGQGRALLETLFAALAKKNVHAVHLGVSGTNTSALAFYRKMGFTPVKETDWGVIMGVHIKQ
ncbi:MAG: GNAT family N-acetyltransferase [Treponema sp.]|jgi:ribosomal protein S18 acetylase RimI-like enzyme|nr:GNAT family N-acetyltransferase [Treponema sp.]